MALPIVSAPMKKNKKPSLVLTLSVAGLLIGAGSAAYWFTQRLLIGAGSAAYWFTQRQPSSRNLLVGANIIPGDALFAVSLTTDPQQWHKLREFGTKDTQAELDKNLVQLRDRFLTNNGYDFQKDIAPWVGDDVTIAILAPAAGNKPAPKPVTTNENTASDQQTMVMVLPVKNPEIAADYGDGIASEKPRNRQKHLGTTQNY